MSAIELDVCEEAVIAAIRKRREHGFRKYGVTVERTDIDLLGWIQHLMEELMDAAIYAERLKREAVGTYDTAKDAEIAQLRIENDKLRGSLAIQQNTINTESNRAEAAEALWMEKDKALVFIKHSMIERGYDLKSACVNVARDAIALTPDSTRSVIAELRAWKEGAMVIEKSLNARGIARLLQLPLGLAIHPQIEPAIAALLARVAELEKTLGLCSTELEGAKLRVRNLEAQRDAP